MKHPVASVTRSSRFLVADAKGIVCVSGGKLSPLTRGFKLSERVVGGPTCGQ